ncbi:hypothetical protein ACSBPU_02300 [Parapusillimonas sp. JC17]|uniref:hypothetical protein n=1 Tax=Parapusillimonas sp. JC17 TaxID=3445768 RepID=UPI003FA1884C
MINQQKGKFPEKIGDLESIKDLSPAGGAGKPQVTPDQDTAKQGASTPDDDPRVNISTADDVDIEPDEEEQSDEPAPPIIPPEKPV